MLALLPIACFAFVYVSSRAVGCSGTAWERRGRALLVAGLVCSAVLVGITEILSVLGALTAQWVAIAWGLAAGSTGVHAIARRRRSLVHPNELPSTTKFARSDLLALCGLTVVLALTLLVVLVSPTTSADTLTYHIPRALHWIQNQAVGHYPTHDSRQLYHPPFAEFVDLHFMLLSGGERLVGLARWFGMVGTLVGVSLVTRRLGGRGRAQITAGVAAVTLPTEIILVTGGKNDCVSALALVALIYFLLRLRDQWSACDGLAAGIALGLAMLTKLTSYLFALPFLLWFGVSILVRHRESAWRPLLCLAIAPLVLNTGHYSRNLDLYGSPLTDPVKSDQLGIERVSASTIASNALRSVTLQVSTPSRELNAYLETAVVEAHELAGRSANDPSTTYPIGKFKILEPRMYDSRTPSPVHFVLAIVCVLLVGTRAALRRNAGTLGYAVALTAAALLFCALLKWQPFHARLHVPLLILAAPVVGIALTALAGRKASNAVLLALLVSALAPLLFGRVRPLLGARSIFRSTRTELTFRPIPAMREPCLETAAWIAERGFRDVGLLPLGGSTAEYPLWFALREAVPDVRIQNVEVSNVSNTLLDREPFESFRPEVLLVVSRMPNEAFSDRADPFPLVANYDGVRYAKELDLLGLAAYVPTDG